ncbi:hypothetical protein FML34_19130 [Klebsiella grimontii]|nr:hypothetical protein [Klebsiella grimontii]
MSAGWSPFNPSRMAASLRLALRLAGLQVYSSLLARSPGKARRAPPPGKKRAEGYLRSSRCRRA